MCCSQSAAQLFDNYSRHFENIHIPFHAILAIHGCSLTLMFRPAESWEIFMIILSSPFVQTSLSHRLFSIWHRWDLAKPSKGGRIFIASRFKFHPPKAASSPVKFEKKLFSLLRIQIDSVASSVPLLNLKLGGVGPKKPWENYLLKGQSWTLALYVDVDVSENSGTPKSSILIRFSIINHPFWGTPIFRNTHVC